MRPALLLLALSALPACGGPAKPADSASQAEVHTTEGTIESIAPNGRVVHIAHDDIPGYMLAMTMPFEAQSPKMLAGLKAGDRVVFKFEERDDGRRVLLECKKK